MFLELAVRNFMDTVKTKVALDYLNLPNQNNEMTNYYYFYDQSLNFEKRLQKRLAYLNYEDREEPFICAMWARSPLFPISEQSRQFQSQSISQNIGKGDTYLSKFAKCNLSVVFVSNDPEYLMTFEEYFTTSFDRKLSVKGEYVFPVSYEELGTIQSIDKTNKKISVQGNVIDDSYMKVGGVLRIFNSTSNDGNYTVTDMEYINPNTVFTVSEDINSNTAEGELTYKDGKATTEAYFYFNNIELASADKLDIDSRDNMMFLQINLEVQYPILQITTSSTQEGTDKGNIINKIIFKEKNIADIMNSTELTMTQPYEEIDIQ